MWGHFQAQEKLTVVVDDLYRQKFENLANICGFHNVTRG